MTVEFRKVPSVRIEPAVSVDVSTLNKSNGCVKTPMDPDYFNYLQGKEIARP